MRYEVKIPTGLRLVFNIFYNLYNSSGFSPHTPYLTPHISRLFHIQSISQSVAQQIKS